MPSARLDSPPPEELWTLNALRDIREEIDRQVDALGADDEDDSVAGAADSSSNSEADAD